MTARVLYIEDNAQNLYLVTFLLNAHGYEVLSTLDGETGIALAEKEKPDLILLDIQLPRMDGYTTARGLRALPGLAQTPIVAVTSYAMTGDREKALEAGCDGYIEKPINPDTFIAQIRTFLRERPGTES